MIHSIDAASSRRGVLTVSFVVLTGLTAAEVVRKGAFYRSDAFTVLIVAIALVAGCIRGMDARSRTVTVLFIASAAWWLIAAWIHGRTASFLPLGASMLAFLASFLVVSRLDTARRSTAGEVLATIGAAAGAVGLAACAMRWYPLSIPSQNLWRLATTITYSDAAGLLVGIALLLGVGLDARRALVRLDVSLCMAGLVATQSRGAALAVLAGAVLVPWGAIRAARWSLLAGLAAGLLVVGTSSGAARQPLAGVGVAALIAAGALVGPSVGPARVTLQRRYVLALVAVGVALIAVTAFALHTPIDRRVELASASDRVAEWRAAFDQWRSSFWTGVGPDVILHVHAKEGSSAYFAHNEYLQIAAGAGVVGEVLVLAAAAAVASMLRRRDVLSSCAVGAVVAFFVAGSLDFDWHLAALGLVGGWAAGLAVPAARERTHHDLRGVPRRDGVARADGGTVARDPVTR